MDEGLNELDPCVDHHIQWDEDKEGQDLEENVWNAGNLRKGAKFEVLYFLGESLKNIEFITFGEIWSYKNWI